MSREPSLQEEQKEWHGTLRSYAIGFSVSILLTALSFGLVVFKAFPPSLLVYVIVALAMVQAAVQLLFFLHLGQEDKPRWETVVFYFMMMVLLIVVLGSLWIMHDLDMRMM